MILRFLTNFGLKLHLIEISFSAILLIEFYLENCSFQVKFGTLLSNPKPIKSGDLEGSALGSIFFNIYINDTPPAPKVAVRLVLDANYYNTIP